MKMPEKLPARLTETDGAAGAAKSTAGDRMNGVSQAGCCASVCAPIVGCHCVAESPFC